MRAPFITTPPEVVARMLQLAGTGPQDTVIDLGSGDGRIVIAAAREHGARGLGIELDPKLVALARENARRYAEAVMPIVNRALPNSKLPMPAAIPFPEPS